MLLAVLLVPLLWVAALVTPVLNARNAPRAQVLPVYLRGLAINLAFLFALWFALGLIGYLLDL